MPLHKKGKLDDVSNLRVITLPSAFKDLHKNVKLSFDELGCGVLCLY